MATIRVSTTIERARAEVWETLEDISSHVDWMADAVAIRFNGEQTRGVGTEFECDTKVGPFKTTDAMEITEWEPTQAMGVRHLGLVTGTGRFTLRDAGVERTEFVWTEDLDFPFWMGGPIRNLVGGRVLEWIWRRNLRRLKELVER